MGLEMMKDMDVEAEEGKWKQNVAGEASKFEIQDLVRGRATTFTQSTWPWHGCGYSREPLALLGDTYSTVTSGLELTRDPIKKFLPEQVVGKFMLGRISLDPVRNRM